jgi:adenylyltransferase/sulfurtransferase
LDLLPVALRADNALELLSPFDVILDGSDNFSTRFLVNDACAKLAKPFLSASIYRFEGQLSLFYPSRGTGCYRCLYPEPPPPGLAPSCAEAGVLGVLPGVMGCLQATEALKFILGIGSTLEGKLLLFDALAMEFRTLKLRPRVDCLACQGKLALTDLPLVCSSSPEISPEQLWQRWQEGWRPILIDVREAYEWDILNLESLGAQRLDAAALEQLELCPEVVVYCKSGARSRQAQEKLLARGFPYVVSLSGGILAFQAALRPDWTRY